MIPKLWTCDPLPSSQAYSLSSLQRSVGQIVKVTCTRSSGAGSSSSGSGAAAMTTVLKCLPELRWNNTVPYCGSDDDEDSPGLVLIIVWTVGGVLLFTLVVLIVLIIKSKNKTVHNTARDGSPQPSVFTVTRGRDWADNPAFSRADERCAELSAETGEEQPDPSRLPSYQEAILSSYLINGRSPMPHSPRPPAENGGPTLTVADVHSADESVFVRANAPPSYRSSQLLHSRYHTRNAAPPRSEDSSSVGAGGDHVSQPGQSDVRVRNGDSPTLEVAQSGDRPQGRDDVAGASSQSGSRGLGDVANCSNQSQRRIDGQGCSGVDGSLTQFSSRHVTVVPNLPSSSPPPPPSSYPTSFSPPPPSSYPTSSSPPPPSSSSTPSQHHQAQASSSRHRPLPTPSLTSSSTSTTAPPLTSRRYAEPYPTCFFEEDPPPPYTPGPAFYRSPVRRSCTSIATAASPSHSASRNYNQTTGHHPHHHHHQHFHRGELSRRTLHAIPSDSSPYRNCQFPCGGAGTPNNQHSRPGASSAQGFSNPCHTSTHERFQESNTTGSIRPEPLGPRERTQNYTLGHQRDITPPSPPPSSLLSPSSSCSTPSSTPVTMSVSACMRDSGYTSANIANTSQHWSTSIRASEVATLNIPRAQFTDGNPQSAAQTSSGDSQQRMTCNAQSAWRGTKRNACSNAHFTNGSPQCTSVTNGENKTTRAATGNPRYVIRSCQATPSAPALDTLPSLIHLEAPPLGTSTPINQSPAMSRRLAPPPHPSVIQNGHGQPIILSGSSASEPTRDRNVCSYGSAPLASVERLLSSQGGFPGQGTPTSRYESPRISTVVLAARGLGHSRQGSAPLARLESEYF